MTLGTPSQADQIDSGLLSPSEVTAISYGDAADATVYDPEPREGSLYSSDVDQSVLMSPPSMVKSGPVMFAARLLKGRR